MSRVEHALEVYADADRGEVGAYHLGRLPAAVAAGGHRHHGGSRVAAHQSAGPTGRRIKWEEPAVAVGGEGGRQELVRGDDTPGAGKRAPVKG